MVRELRVALDGQFEDTSKEFSDQYLLEMLEWAASDRAHKLSDLLNPDLKFLWVLPKYFDKEHLLDVEILEDIVSKLATEVSPVNSKK